VLSAVKEARVLAESFATRVWSALVNPVGGSPERHPLPTDASDGARLWAAMTLAGAPVVDEYRHGQPRRHRKQAAKRFAIAADRLASDVSPDLRWTAIEDLAALADDDEVLRQASVDVLCSYLRASVSGVSAPDSDTRHQVLDTIASRLHGQAGATWRRCVFNLAGVAVDSLDFSNVWIDELADFAHCSFSEGKVSFAGARFSGTVIFAGSVFSGARLDFSHAQFEGNVDFSGSTFDSAAVSFVGARFSGKVDFTGCAFTGTDVTFSDAEFADGRVDFTASTLEAGEFNFAGAHFKGGTVDLRAPRALPPQPMFGDWVAEPPPGLLLPGKA
jgi:uncharacterized protein YjbI with pentapeptide repeats